MNNTSSPDAIGWTGEFKDREFESGFRTATLENTRRLVMAAAMAILLGNITLAINDIGTQGMDPAVMWARNIQALIALFSCWLAWRRNSWPAVYTVTWLLAVSVIGVTTVIDLSRPSDYLLHLTVDLLILMGIYIAVPTVKAQVVIAFNFSAILLWIVFTQKTPQHDLALLTAPLVVFLANFLGLAMSLVYNRVKRQFYAKAEAERGLRESLEAAHHELDQLSKLLPICSSCKKINNDSGEWQELEVYLEAVSGQRFTHGICPECVSRIYPDDLPD